MENQSVIVDLPEPIYQQVAERAELAHVSVADELINTLTAAYSRDRITPKTQETLLQLDFLSDEELWNAARLQISTEIHAQMEALLEKRQIGGLTAAEQKESDRLVAYTDHVMLVRAKAAALLHRRGQDVSSLMQPSAV